MVRGDFVALASFDTAFDLQTASLIVVKLAPAGFDAAFDLQANRLAVLYAAAASFDIALYFHATSHFLIVVLEHPASFDAAGCGYRTSRQL